MRPPVVFLALPHRNDFSAGTLRGVLNTGKGHKLIVEEKQNSLLTVCFNSLWCEALNNRKKHGLTHFAMLHCDIGPQEGWIDILLREQKKCGADILSVVVPIKDERGQHITDFVLGQDMMAWVTQGPIAERNLEKLAESDEGVILFRRLLQEQLAIAEAGEDPMNVFRDPAANTFIEIPVEYGLIQAARAQQLATGQAPWSPLLDIVEETWANAPKSTG